MRVTVLCDDNTTGNLPLLGEPSFCLYLENAKDNILYDVGRSDVYVKNAKSLGIDLDDVNKIVLSHGHTAHTGGLLYFNYDCGTSVYYGSTCFDKKFYLKTNITAPYTLKEMKDKFDCCEVNGIMEVSPNLYAICGIERKTPYEKHDKFFTTRRARWKYRDNISEELVLAYFSGKKIYVLTACSHVGIVNICEYIKIAFGRRVYGIIGGLDLFRMNERTEKTIEYLKSHKIKLLCPCHNTSFRAKAEMFKAGLPVQEVYCGFHIDI